MCDEITVLETKLIEHSISEGEYSDTLYRIHLFEQYKLYVEMADRISQRRGFANILFLTLNTGVLAALSTIVEKSAGMANQGIQLVALIGLVFSCIAWRSLIRSYRQLNTAKYKIIGAYERMLPSSPYFNAEWNALGEGVDRTKYTPLTVVESYLPVGLATAYFTMIVVLIIDNHEAIRAIRI